jgi:UDP-N-acetyl-D-mannosaminuronate dehydrogenase
LEDAVIKSDALIIITDHTDIVNRLKKLDLYNLGVRIVIDGRNCLDPNIFDNSGIFYKGIGR